MNKADSDRLEREASIRAAVRGPDFTMLNQSIANAKADWQKHQAMSQDNIRQQRFGHYQAVARGERHGPYKEPGE